MRKTKIIATIGPASASPMVIDELLLAGMNVARLNCSHGTSEERKMIISDLRASSVRLDIPLAILLDLQGPRIRTGKIRRGSVELKAGRTVHITTEDIEGNEEVIPTTYKAIISDVSPGDRILIDDGLIELKVSAVKANRVECDIIYGGILKNHKGMNLPGVNLSAPSLTEKDVEDIEFGTRHKVDYIALSFVRKASDITGLRDMLREKDADIPIIAKIEKPEAIENLESIIATSDGVMVARGDLGVEISAEEVPIAQKRIISMANAAGKTVITATQMLDSMINNPRPTRAEASDVANAVIDGTDALMLSGETAVGRYPVDTVRMMAKIAMQAEDASMSKPRIPEGGRVAGGSFAKAVAFASYAASIELNSKAIIVFTQSGTTASFVSKLRPGIPVIAFTPMEETRRKLALVWGVQPFCIEFGGHTDEMICRGEAAMLNNGLAEWGDTVVVVSGTKVGMRGATNMMKIDMVGSEECKLFLHNKS